MESSIRISLLQVAFGLSIIYGDKNSNNFLIEIVKYILYIHCEFALWIFSFFASVMEKPLYNDVIVIFNNIPYKVSEHYNEYPQLFVLSGVLILMSGISSIVHLSKSL